MASDSWRVVLFSVTAAVIPALERGLKEQGHRLVGVLTAPGPRARRTDDYLEVAQLARPGLDVIISNYPGRWPAMVRAWKPDLIVCASFNWKFPPEVLEIPRLGAINGHDALLPKYRGRNATGWALRNDDPEFGFTVHYMTPDWDTGPILAQRRIPITEDDHSVDSIIPRFFEAVEKTYSDAYQRIAEGDPGTPQDESQVSHAGGMFEPEWRVIDWNRPARDIFVQVRSWHGSRDVPRGAFATLDGNDALLTATRLTNQHTNHVEPGTILERRDDGSLLVQCGDGPLEILRWDSVAG